MVSGGKSCQVSLEVEAGGLQPLGTWTFKEDIIAGSILRCRIAVEDAPALAPGTLLTLKVKDIPGSKNDPSAVNLWISKVTKEGGLQGNALYIEATDPLSHCLGLPQFRSYVGDVSLDIVVRHILSNHCAYITEKPRLDKDFPKLPQKWLLQAEEGGAEFLQRLAADLGTIIYWDRDCLRCSVKGRTPANASATKPTADKGNFSTITVMGLPHTSGSLWWTDSVERRTRSLKISGSSKSAGEVHQRILSLNPPPISHALSTPNEFDRGTTFHATGPLVSSRLGDLIRSEDGEEFCIEEAVHEFDNADSYRSNVMAVPPTQWGRFTTPSGPGLIGPFPATVTHNHDPDGLGRIRVTLSEDPEARPSPFIPVVTATSGHEMGTLLVPEIGESVLVAADCRCPEDLCCLGAVRAGKNPLPAFCREEGNGIKMLMTRNGVGLVLDDQEMAIKLVTPEATLKLGQNGEIALEGKSYFQKMSNESSIESIRRIKLNGNRIELG